MIKNETEKTHLSKEEIEEIVAKMLTEKKKYNQRLSYKKVDDNIVVIVKSKLFINFDKFARRTQRKIIENYLKRLFSDKKPCTNDNVCVKTSSAGLKKLTSAMKPEDYKFVLYADVLVQTANFIYSNQDEKGRQMTYRYYRAFISFSGLNVYSMQLNIRTDHMGSVLYDINKINQVGLSDSASRGLSDFIYTIANNDKNVKIEKMIIISKENSRNNTKTTSSIDIKINKDLH